MDVPTCDKCGGDERPVIRYSHGVVRCQRHLIKVILAAEVVAK